MRIGSLRTDGRRRSAVAMRWALGGDGGGTGGTGGGGWTNRRAGIVRGGSTAPLFARVRIRITRLCCSSLMGLCTDSANSPCGLRENAGKSPNGGGESASSSPAAVSSGSSGGVGAFGRWDASRPMDVTLAGLAGSLRAPRETLRWADAPRGVGGGITTGREPVGA